nr:hypothetical protein [uncultured Methanobrevibacter sp.]
MVIYLINYYSEGGILKINEKTSTIIIAAFSQLTHQLIANMIVAALPEFKMNVLK